MEEHDQILLAEQAKEDYQALLALLPSTSRMFYAAYCELQKAGFSEEQAMAILLERGLNFMGR